MPDYMSCWLSRTGAGMRLAAVFATGATVVACAKPLPVNIASVQNQAAAAVAGRAPSEAAIAPPDSQPPIVVVRYYAHAPTVSVVAWDGDRPAYGLRATIRRDGTLAYDHQLFVSTYHFVELRAFFRADWNFATPDMEAPQRLLYTGVHWDVHSCEEDDGEIGCSPFVTLRARIPDDLLRNGGEDVSVRIIGRGYNEVTLNLRRSMINAYLKKVDAVSAAIIAN